MKIMVIRVHNIQQRLTVWLYLYEETSLFLPFLNELLVCKLRIKLNDVISSMFARFFVPCLIFELEVTFRLELSIMT